MTVAILTLCLLVASCALPKKTLEDEQPDRAERPNIVLIMADDLGYECLSCNKGQSYATPALDRLAQNGIRFTHCYSQPLCTPSRVQIMTGKYNFRNYKMFGYLDLKETTFGHILRNAGYATCIAGKWQLGNGIEAPHLMGFDEYCLWQIYNNVAGKDVRGPRYPDPRIYRNGRVLDDTKGRYGPDVFVDFIIDFMRSHKDEPFLVYYPMVLTHVPFKPTPASEEWKSDRYIKDKRFFKDMVEYMDHCVDRIVGELDALGLREETLVIFTGDNGSPRPVRSKCDNAWIQGGKAHMTDAGTHVPLIANWPDTIPAEQVSDELVDFSDFLPTLAAVAKTNPPEKITVDGKSFLPLMLGEKGAVREWVYCYYWGRGRDVFKAKAFARDKRYKLYDDGGFFDLSIDPLEEEPLPESIMPESTKSESEVSESEMPYSKMPESESSGSKSIEEREAIRSMLQGVLDQHAR